MKRILLLFVLLMSGNVFAQGLNSEAQIIKEKRSELFSSLKVFSANKWKTDYSMILYEINEQSKSYLAVMDYLKENEEEVQPIVIEALKKYSDGNAKKGVEGNSTIDWTMVHYELKNQIESKKAIYSGENSLSDLSKAVKLSDPELFDTFHDFASNKYDSQREIDKEINNQIKHFEMSNKLVSRYGMRGREVLQKSLDKNSIGGTRQNFTYNPTIDWVGVYTDIETVLEPSLQN